MATRRELLKRLSALPLVGGMFGTAVASGQVSSAVLSAPARDLFKELGVRTFINAAGTYTAMTGSLMPEEVISTIVYGTSDYVNLDELQDKVGERIAEMLDCEYATVSSGAFGAMTIGLAGVIAGMDTEKVAQMPDLTGMKDEVIVQKAHNIGYTHALRNVGAKLVMVETAKELEKAINKQTAMLWFLNANVEQGQIKWEEFVALGKKHNIPTFIDCAADVPPVENLFRFTKMGFDLVCFSGGKGLRGPQSAGLLLGKKDYIKAARLHCPPRGSTIARGMKVNKEEVLGMYVALESYLKKDHKKEWNLWEAQIELIRSSAAAVDGVKAEVHVPEQANHVPSLRISWDNSKVKISPDDARKELRMGHPSIETVGNDEHIGITTWMMKPGQENIVAKRLKEILSAAV
ncbi:MAG: selenocysteine synthase [Cyclobacteriaceae bacterium]|nr:selenocysteine synthase [Cyclobacteriaceae bacterium]